MPVEIQNPLLVRLPVPRISEPAATAEQQRPILAGITGLHLADHYRLGPHTPGNDPADTSHAAARVHTNLVRPAHLVLHVGQRTRLVPGRGEAQRACLVVHQVRELVLDHPS